MRGPAIVVFLALLAGACQSATGPCETAPVAVAGTWRYGGAIDAPVNASLSGTLQIVASGCDGFNGRLDLTQTNAQGQVQRLSGPVSGRVLSATSLRFDAYLEAAPRQHVATLAGDSLSGSWVAIGGAGQAASGSFGGKREAGQ